MQIHERLTELLKGYKQREVAERLDRPPSAVNQWLRGKKLCGQRELTQIVEKFVPGDRATKKAELAHLLVLWQHARVERERLGEGTREWTESSKELALEAIVDVCSAIPRPKSEKRQDSARTLVNFPEAFNLTVVSGDKREVSESRISIGDFGTVSASPAESRWMLNLGLDREVECFTDKVFVSESAEQLQDRFGHKDLLVIGSPASNHLARRLLLVEPPQGWRPGVPVFRFNFEQECMRQIERLLVDLSGLNAKQLVGKQGDPETERQVKFWLHELFSGGILDPAYRDLWKRAGALHNVDFGLVSLARNPFSDPKDPKVCILAAGFHMFGTAHAVKMLSEPELFAKHPLGGVIIVNYNPGDDFAVRFDNSTASWDTGTASDYEIDDVKAGLKALQQKIPAGIHTTPEEIEECLSFIDTLQ